MADEKLHPNLVDFDEPSDELCDRYHAMLQMLDGEQEGFEDIKIVHRTLKINHRVGNFVLIKLLGTGRVTRATKTSGRGQRKRATGAVYVWQNVPEAIVGGDA